MGVRSSAGQRVKYCSFYQRLLELDEFPLDRGKRYSQCETCQRAKMYARYLKRRTLRLAKVPV